MVAEYPQCDLVTKNEILKSLETLEDKASRKWKQKWGFYLDFDKFCLEEARKRGYNEEEYRRITKKVKPKGSTEPSLWVVEPCSKAVPKISSEYVGWRSEPQCSLEKFGPLYVSPRHGLPYQAPLKCIILG